MTSLQTSSDLLSSLAVQIRETESVDAVTDLYLLARGVYYAEADKSLDGTPHKTELRSAWKLVVDEMKDWNQTHPPTVVGLVTFSDGSSYGGKK